MSLQHKIQEAMRSAGENVVIRDLKEKGLIPDAGPDRRDPYTVENKSAFEEDEKPFLVFYVNMLGKMWDGYRAQTVNCGHIPSVLMTANAKSEQIMDNMCLLYYYIHKAMPDTAQFLLETIQERCKHNSKEIILQTYKPYEQS